MFTSFKLKSVPYLLNIMDKTNFSYWIAVCDISFYFNFECASQSHRPIIISPGLLLSCPPLCCVCEGLFYIAVH